MAAARSYSGLGRSGAGAGKLAVDCLGEERKLSMWWWCGVLAGINSVCCLSQTRCACQPPKFSSRKYATCAGLACHYYEVLWVRSAAQQ